VGRRSGGDAGSKRRWETSGDAERRRVAAVNESGRESNPIGKSGDGYIGWLVGWASSSRLLPLLFFLFLFFLHAALLLFLRLVHVAL